MGGDRTRCNACGNPLDDAEKILKNDYGELLCHECEEDNRDELAAVLHTTAEETCELEKEVKRIKEQMGRERENKRTQNMAARLHFHIKFRKNELGCRRMIACFNEMGHTLPNVDVAPYFA